MARTPDVLDDPTPIDGPGVDVRVRVAWLLRMSRSATADGVAASVTEMAGLLRDRGLAATPPSVSGWETGRVAPSTAVVEAYERALDLEPGHLRGAIDMVRRTFGVDVRSAYAAVPALRDVDRAVEPVLGGGPVTGAEWLHFSDAAVGVQPGLPARVMRPLVDRLVSELARSVFTGYLTRYEGLALLRCGQYADVVLEAVRAFVDEPGNQVVADVFSMVAEKSDLPVLDLVTSYLGSDDPVQVRGAVLALENLHMLGGLTPAHWQRVVEPFVAAHRAAADDGERSPYLAALWHLLPREVRAAAEPRLRHPPPPPADTGTAGDRREELELCGRLADRTCAAVGIVAQPLLARLVHEALFDPRHTRSFTSAVVLMASPLRSALAAALGDASQDEPSPHLREATAELLVALGDHRAVPHASRWVHSGDPELIGPGLVALAHVGAPVDDASLAVLLEQPGAVGRRAVYHAGMVGHEAVGRLARDPTHPRQQAAQWWQRHGSMVTA
jgi:hypothetical protein